MKFKIDLDIKPLEHGIEYSHKIYTTGSCFAQNIADRLMENKFSIFQNPNGIVFDPISIFNSIKTIINNGKIAEDDFFYINNVWHSLNYHGSINNTNKEVLIQNITTQNTLSNQYLKQAKWLIITIGSAYVYQLKKNNKIVANCHKIPQHNFEKRLLTADEIISSFADMHSALKQFNSNINIILTVSPVKHLRDGVIENNLSKGTLLLAANAIKEKHFVNYFPSYEIVNDELRDYRFYEMDFAHPNKVAIDYVWQKFAETCFTSSTKNIFSKVDELVKAYKHRPLNHDVLKHNQFKKTYFDKCIQLQKAHPYINLESEMAYFSV